MKKLSIIIPVYNVEKYLPKCINSVINCKNYDYEIIAVNDGSTDNSSKILESYAKNYPNLIRIINKENGGLGSARNAGLAVCNGKYVVFIDSDDYLTENALDKYFEFLKEDFDILIYDATPVNESGEPIGYIKGASANNIFNLKEYPEILFYQPSVWNKIYRTDLFKNNGILFPDSAWFEDIRTIPKLYIHSSKMLYKEISLYNYLQRSGSITNSSNDIRNLEIIEAMDDVLGYFIEQKEFDNYYSQLEYMTFYNELLTSIDRVNLINYNSDVQSTLYEDVQRRFPNYEKNVYFKTMPKKHLLIYSLIKAKKWKTLNLLLKVNNLLKNK